MRSIASAGELKSGINSVTGQLESMPLPPNDIHDRRASNRVRAQLHHVHSAGAWMPWAGAGMALAIWAGAGLWLLTTLGPAGIFAQPPLLLAGAAAVFVTPGVALICAGFMARESRRTREANAIVLTSARLLLEPASHARSEITSIAEAVSRETQHVNKALSETRTRMDALKQDIEASVTSALKAAEIVRADSEVLVSRMNSERQNLTELAEAIRNQADSFAKAIPRHAQLLAEASRSAQDEVRRAEETIDQRLRGIEDTSRRLAERIGQLDTMGAESRKRAQNLAGALMRLDEQLVQSTRMVDAARGAGEMATAAAKNTADSLRDAMSDALDTALKAAETINARSAAASEEAQKAMARLQEVGQKAEATTRAAGLAAQAQADAAEARIRNMPEAQPHMAPPNLNQHVATVSYNGFETHNGEDNALLLDRPVSLHGAETVQAPAQKPTAHAHAEYANRNAPPPPVQPRPAPAAHPVNYQPVTVHHGAPNGGAPNGRDASLSWRDLLTGIEELDPAPRPIQSHIQTSPQYQAQPQYQPQYQAIQQPARPHPDPGRLLDRLGEAGVRLPIVKASDLRRIASASHQGEWQRRRATRDLAPGEIQRVSRLLDSDRDLQSAARIFIANEGPLALKTLALADRTRDDAAPRLSAYLLLDAALSGAAF